MKRRNFIGTAAAASTFVIGGFPMQAVASPKLAQFLLGCEGINERALILIQLKGGNDGLNMLVPLDQYDKYANLRPTIRQKETGAGALISLDSTVAANKKLGLHPAMAELKELYDAGKMAVCQSVGYEMPNQSHFKSTDLWLTGGDGTPANYNLGTGWMGRYLGATYPDVHGEPIPAMLDPLGIQVGDPKPSLGFHTESQHPTGINLSGQNPAGFYNLVNSVGGSPINPIPAGEYGDELSFILNVENSTSKYAQRISDVFNAGSNSTVVYPTSSLANQLKTIARLIKGGSKTRIFLTQLGGFDTHDSQVDPTDTNLGEHADLLADLSKSIKAFQDDLESMGLAERTMSVTFSEFGRCAAENGNFGTDHGQVAPMFIVGTGVQAGIFGENVNLSDLTTDNQIKNRQFDYRQVFTTVLQDFLGANDSVLAATQFDPFSMQKIGFVDGTAFVDPGCYVGSLTPTKDVFAQNQAIKIYPNPAFYRTEMNVKSDKNFDARLSIIDLHGRTMMSQTTRISAGENILDIFLDELSAGQYLVKLEGGTMRETAKLLVIR
jgi:uncharacterized protein (DUF1501 family)